MPLPGSPHGSAACLKKHEDEDHPQDEHEDLYCFDRSQTAQPLSDLPHDLAYGVSDSAFPVHKLTGTAAAGLFCARSTRWA
jgi:hypothetical protein